MLSKKNVKCGYRRRLDFSTMAIWARDDCKVILAGHQPPTSCFLVCLSAQRLVICSQKTILYQFQSWDQMIWIFYSSSTTNQDIVMPHVVGGAAGQMMSVWGGKVCVCLQQIYI